MIIFEDISKSYATGETVLDGVSFQVEPQELVLISGPSGSGKTTLLRMMVKDLEPSSGRIVIDGDDLTQLKSKYIPSLRRKVGFAFQDYKVIPDKTVNENIGLGLEIIGLKPAAIYDRVNHLLELIGMQNKGQLFPRQLSGGELQRVAIARAIGPEPKILLADEPTGNLDPETAEEIIKLLNQINQMGTTVMVTSHNLQMIHDLNARHMELRHGKISKDSKVVEDPGPSSTDDQDKPKPKKKVKKHKKEA
jgi:cell division transport system ATP-binding protein